MGTVWVSYGWTRRKPLENQRVSVFLSTKRYDRGILLFSLSRKIDVFRRDNTGYFHRILPISTRLAL